MSKYFNSIDESVFSISARQQAFFDEANGHEFSLRGRKKVMKICSQYSSSALAINMLGPIESQNLGGDCWDNLFALRGFFGKRKVCCQFEKKLHIPNVRGYPPNLDFYICGDDRYVGVESKYREMYSRKRNQVVAPQYINKFKRWREYPGLKKIAIDVNSYTADGRLDAAQLVKHCLALISASGDTGKFRLIYIYHDITDKSVDEEHSAALKNFSDTAKLGRHFITLPYSKYLKRLKLFFSRIPNAEEYRKFLIRRYGDLEW